MPDAVTEGPFPLKRQFPALRLFEATTVALSPGSVLVAVVTTVAVGLSGWFVDSIFPADTSAQAQSRALKSFSLTIGFATGNQFTVSDRLATPWSSVAAPLINGLTSTAGISTRFGSLTRFLLILAIWSFSGVVLCRRSVYLFAGNDESNLRRALGYAGTRWLTTFCNPMIPLGAAFLFCVIMAAIGLLGRLPAWGSTWLFIVSPIAAVVGFAIAFLFIVTMLAWPLVVAAVSVDDRESFLGLSSAYSLITQRPWHTVGYIMLSLLVGALLTSMLIALGEASIWCGVSAAAMTSGEEQVHRSLLAPLTSLVHAMITGVETSFFWSAATMIYLLLRKDVDRMPFERFALDDQDRPPRDPLPVVGIPATDAGKSPESEILAINR